MAIVGSANSFFGKLPARAVYSPENCLSASRDSAFYGRFAGLCDVLGPLSIYLYSIREEIF